MEKLAVNNESILHSTGQAGAGKYCCQKHVTEALKVVHLPHIAKVKYQGKVCGFCGRKARYQFFSLY
ncbi:hypothetical protein L2D08_14710 [Domibacillus sp. PGB-M46]|uniref:hypothetical protein n=1 Tax=Domibacillus sp. PGB-M46 TaxID=2910255 RepID=UPI001F5AC2ED|nr:hypothetical protein [Domibacillus sp. PGB-M46]MCI2255621.1 hypothetical protein [Domibacillus sp. PGB-M46]